MGNTSTKENDESSETPPILDVDPDYQVSLQKYFLTAAAPHQQLTTKKCKKPDKAKPKEHPLDAWTVGQICNFVETTCMSRYGSNFNAIKEVVDNFQIHLVDGMAVNHLRPEDWQVLCPYIGPRIWLMNRIQELNKEDAAQPAAPPVAPSGPLFPPKPELHLRAASILAAQRQRIQVAWEAAKGSPTQRTAVDPYRDIQVGDVDDQTPRMAAPVAPVAKGIVPESDERPPSPEIIPEVPHLSLSMQDTHMASQEDLDPADLLTFMNSDPHTPNVHFARRRSVFSMSQKGTKVSKPITERMPRSPASSISTIPFHFNRPFTRASTRPGTRPGTRAQRLIQSIRLSWVMPDSSSDATADGEHHGLSHLLFTRSRFSNHRLIDTPWRADPTLPLYHQLWQHFVHLLLRIVFTLYTSLRVGLAPHELIFLLIPALSTTVCLFMGWMFDFSPTIFVTIVVFPLTFSLNAAYNRREQALQILANIKAGALALYLTSRSWAGTQAELPPNYARNTSTMVKGLFRNFGHYLTSVNEADRATILSNVYQQYVDLCLHVDLLRLADLPPTLLGVPFNNLVNMILAFERLRVFSDYRTPCTIRSHFWSCLVVLSIIMGPYCAFLANTHSLFYGYAVNMTFFWLLLAMNNIQSKLENPFSKYGEANAEEDDINLVTLRGGQEPSKPMSPG